MTNKQSDRIIDHEALETSAVVSQLADAVQDEIDDFLADGVMSTGKVVSLKQHSIIRQKWCA